MQEENDYVPFGTDTLEEPGCLLYKTTVESETPRSIGASSPAAICMGR